MILTFTMHAVSSCEVASYDALGGWQRKIERSRKDGKEDVHADRNKNRGSVDGASLNRGGGGCSL